MICEWRTHVWIHNLRPDDKLVLDAGCSTGLFGTYAKDYGHFEGQVIGVDLDNLALAKAKMLLDSVIRADVRCLPFKATAFNLAVSTEVLEHLKKADGPKFISELGRVASRFVVSTPNGFSVGDVKKFKEHPLMKHQSGWTVKELRGLGARKIRGISFRYGNSLFRIAMSAFSWVYPNYAEFLIAIFN